MPLDVQLGPLFLPTVYDDIGEAVGDTLTTVGPHVFAGERRARPFTLSLPIHGADTDADPYAAGDRMRRQVRALMQNNALKSQGIYFQFIDDEVNGWLLIGSGDLTYAEGGPSLSEYRLALSECYRVATLRTHRPAKRLESYDRRLSTTPRDFRGTVFKTDFANTTLVPQHALGPEASDVIGAGRTPVLPATRRGMYGALPILTSRPHGEVLSYEQPEGKLSEGVRIYDRRGNLDVVPTTNWVHHPTFADGLSQDWVPFIGGSFTIVGGKLRFVGTAINHGAILDSPIFAPTDLVVQPSMEIRSISGATLLQLTAIAMGPSGEYLSYALPQFTINGTATRYVSTPFTVPKGAAFLRIILYNPAASASTWEVDRVSSLPYYADGDSPGWGWLDHRGRSASVRNGSINLITDPDLINGSSQWPVGGGFLAPTGFVKRVPDPGGHRGAAGQVLSRYDNTGTYCRVTLEAGRPYTVRARVRRVSGPATGKLAITQVAGPNQTVLLAPTIDHADWREYSGTITPNVGGSYDLYVVTNVATPFTGAEFRLGRVTVSDGDVGTFSGDDHGCGWLGERAKSASIKWSNPETWGWEQVLGPDQPLSVNDVPVIENGLCRLRWVHDQSALAVDSYVEGHGYQEQGRVTVWRDWSSVRTQYVADGFATDLNAQVLEWTQDCAVVKFTLGFAGTTADRVEVYLTLRAGDVGPRVEAYASNPVLAVGAAIRWSVNPGSALSLGGGGADLVTLLQSGTVGGMSHSDALAWGSLAVTPTPTAEPWMLLMRHDTPGDPTTGKVGASRLKSTVFLPTHQGYTFRGFADAVPYGAAYGSVLGLSVDGGATTPIGYAGLQLGFVDGALVLDATAWRNTSGTNSVQADGAAFGGTALQETQTVPNNETVSISAAELAALGVKPGRYRIRVRWRAVGAADTASMVVGFLGGASTSDTVTLTSTTYTEILTAEVVLDTVAGCTFAVYLWRSAGSASPNTRIDRIVLEPLDRTLSLDGPRDLARAALADTRVLNELVARS